MQQNLEKHCWFVKAFVCPAAKEHVAFTKINNIEYILLTLENEFVLI